MNSLNEEQVEDKEDTFNNYLDDTLERSKRSIFFYHDYTHTNVNYMSDIYLSIFEEYFK